MAAGSTYTPLATTTANGGSGVITFSSISGAYTDLVLISNETLSSTGNNLLMTFNSDTGSNYSDTDLVGDGTSASSGRASNGSSIRVGYFTSSRVINAINIMNYANSTTYKTSLIRWNTESYVVARVGLWRSTAAITSITLTAVAGNIDSGSTFTLYGIAAA